MAGGGRGGGGHRVPNLLSERFWFGVSKNASIVGANSQKKRKKKNDASALRKQKSRGLLLRGDHKRKRQRYAAENKKHKPDAKEKDTGYLWEENTHTRKDTTNAHRKSHGSSSSTTLGIEWDQIRREPVTVKAT